MKKTKRIGMLIVAFVLIFTMQVTTVFAAEGFEVTTSQNVDWEGDQYTNLKVSYNGMSSEALWQITKGKTDNMAVSFSPDNGATWGAWQPVALIDSGRSLSYTEMQIYRDYQVRFCMTELPFVFKYSQDLSDPKYHYAITDTYSLSSSYNDIPEPFLVRSTPTVTSVLKVSDEPFNVTLTFNDFLEQTDDISVNITTDNNTVECYGDKVTFKNYYEDVTIDGVTDTYKRCDVEFDMTTDSSYNSQRATSVINIAGLVGENSQKAPKQVPYITVQYYCNELTSNCTEGSLEEIYYMEQPRLIENVAIDVETYDYKGNQSNLVSDVLLIARNGSRSATFEIPHNDSGIIARLNRGHIATLAVPSPNGFSYRESSVYYEAYKAEYNSEEGKYEFVEIPVNVTEKGIEIEHI